VTTTELRQILAFALERLSEIDPGSRRGGACYLACGRYPHELARLAGQLQAELINPASRYQFQIAVSPDFSYIRMSDRDKP
jgi:hypothetical protein